MVYYDSYDMTKVGAKIMEMMILSTCFPARKIFNLVRDDFNKQK